ncbi:uncharacterized protein LOC132061203 [Lycium ferocissimum]|uniref:uncharacterized protein LOC132061203 n=1 Tax=Lycium ferocissimum TaxID=112874 RepID=UPI0028164405|nr:uncharacterized protein LOC132061203 [Lycium ferocissimum]
MEPPDNLSPATTGEQNGVSAQPISYANRVATSSGGSAPTKSKESVVGRHTTHNGKVAVIFKSKDYYGVLVEDCRRTIVEKFPKPRPQIDKIRAKFKELITIKGSVTISVFDNYNVFIDCTNDDDFKTVWYRRIIEIEDAQMWLQKWIPHFKPEEDIPIVLVWVLLLGLSFQIRNWHIMKQILRPVGTPLCLDAATTSRTRPSMTKARVKIDLLKPRIFEVWVGLEDEDSPLKGFTQKMEYENIPKYCKHCKKLGHYQVDFWVLERKRAKEKQEEAARPPDQVGASSTNHQVNTRGDINKV